MNARLLVYCKIGAMVDGWEVGMELPEEKWAEISGPIAAEKDAMWKQNLFLSRPFTQLVLKAARFDELWDFYFDVFCHSANLTVVPEFLRRFAELKPSSGLPVTWMTEHFDDKLAPVLKKAHQQIQLSVVKLIEASITGDFSPTAGQLLNKLIAFLSTSHRFPDLNIAGLLQKFLTTPEAISFAKANNWPSLLGVALRSHDYTQIGKLLDVKSVESKPVDDHELKELDVLATLASPAFYRQRQDGAPPVNSIPARGRFIQSTEPTPIHDYLTNECRDPREIREVILILSMASPEFRQACVRSMDIFAGWTLLDLAEDHRQDLNTFILKVGEEHPGPVISELRLFLDKPEIKTLVQPAFFSLVLQIAKLVGGLSGAWPELAGYPSSPELEELRTYLERFKASCSTHCQV
jgi:hypothetical protein